MIVMRWPVAAIVTMICATAVSAQAPVRTPKGFTPLFNGKDLTGWRGRQPNFNPVEEAKLTKEEHAAKQAEWNTARDAHWKVDATKGRSSLMDRARISRPRRTTATSNSRSTG